MTDTADAVRQLRGVTDADVEDMDSVMSHDKIRIFDGIDGDGVHVSNSEIPDGWEIRDVEVSDSFTHVILYEKE
jgi:hypothetical protein